TFTNFSNSTLTNAFGIAKGSDGALWVATTSPSNAIVRVTPSGSNSITATAHTNAMIINPEAIINGPDGALWFTNNNYQSTLASIGRMTTGGTVTTYAPGLGSNHNRDLTSGPDGAIWFLDGNDVQRIDLGAPAAGPFADWQISPGDFNDII